MFARLRCGGNLPLCLAFGTGVLGVLWWLGGWHSVPERATYGTEYACRAQKGFLGYATHFQRHSVRKNRLFRYGRDIRCQKQPSLVRDASSKARRTADSSDCGQPTGVRDAFSEACRAKNSTCRTGRIFSARNSPRSEVSRHKKRVTSKSIKTF